MALIERAKSGDILLLRVPEYFPSRELVAEAQQLICRHLQARGVTDVAVIAVRSDWSIEKLSAAKLAELGYARIQ